ncbi:AraC family transcriptional regulator [Paenibacillus sacheonensis]|uniref:Helix-turn-helix domain-containing protein n=1 Tax=Paenibacillus sacheonensis TaxID=742054 RepID=A0A7X4YLM7_9BACL|nr:AraC family transcriptional regulator [Paenibacillus sacheonensis]MBM7566070.1 AraC-like DNA-binding protein/mannose-6-phosphate isomerase-like protein (cupin superfamily) [Paenibacillus sacheonensis]NBC68621.1 helix-turn-helix domain-containing protein [Paenibacillus sacheonensis]
MGEFFEPGSELVVDLHAMSNLHFSFQIYGIHWRSVRQGWSYAEHEHPLLELNLVLAGTQVTRVGDKEYVQRPGDLLLIPPGREHASRCEGIDGMTFFCLHLNIDDHFIMEPFYHLTDLLNPGHSDLTVRLRPLLDDFIEEASNPSGLSSTYQRIRMKANALSLITALSEMLLRDGSGFVDREFSDAERRTMLGAVKMREQTLMEKRVQDLFYGTLGAEASKIYEALLPSYRWISVCSISRRDTLYWDNRHRASAGSLLEEVLSSLGSVVIIDDLLLTAVVFSDRISVPPVEQKMLEAEKRLQKNVDPNLRLGFGGITSDLREVGSMYEQSLMAFSADSLDPASECRTIEFVNRIIRFAMNRLETEYANKDFSLGLLAESLDVSPNYLSALFTTETGMTFTQHLTRIRMEHAKRLLNETRLKIYQICQEVGYSDQAYFSRLFKSLEGRSPFNYREHSRIPGDND